MPHIADTHIVNRERVQPTHANNYESAHGGIVMKWMDEIGAMSAMRAAEETCVTAQMSRVDFERPIPIGDTALVESWAYATGRTSVRVRIEVSRENPRTGETEETTSAYATFVAVEDGTPVPVPELTVHGEKCKELRDRALAEEPERE
ncbi:MULTISPECIES: acyl-CoA thioesterase [Haloarcula]|uniref:Acyl-CoA thioesterase n=1 Tax=Haloarcula pellucida TaxID=1427151 RepID=A0A830GQJ6_9EURY|nr:MULTISPECIES: acyl-CoA thioesterase [Halomicroarcula]MBX0349254.1 acyl-CoA thioesterase [Halomicroarcula pellucida]MDS0279155.1 acyl-CoA thioesterase [Halomicroarcula sp. S1AR25-4]QIO21519.1 acyl-CoA thioesterase [Haloarcula sp. JP-L23]GGN99728.1 acyl-CoA thioesterase [Halomicroarcula pellucida]